LVAAYTPVLTEGIRAAKEDAFISTPPFFILFLAIFAPKKPLSDLH
jgi:hypothetical protein